MAFFFSISPKKRNTLYFNTKFRHKQKLMKTTTNNKSRREVNEIPTSSLTVLGTELENLKKKKCVLNLKLSGLGNSLNLVTSSLACIGTFGFPEIVLIIDDSDHNESSLYLEVHFTTLDTRRLVFDTINCKNLIAL
jgi:hypothetical protein